MLTSYGRDNAFLMLGIGTAILLLAATPVSVLVRAALIALGLVLIAFTLWFFRDSNRPLNPEANNPAVIVAPADGSVTEVVAVNHPDIGGDGTQISIFLSPLDLHVNRFPASGFITAVRYFPGTYLMAFHPKASLENERSEFVLQTTYGPILFRQITGFLARRIVYDVQQGAVAHAGQRFGMMKFGSRMDVLVPSTATVMVHVGDKVVSAATIIARLQQSELA